MHGAMIKKKVTMLKQSLMQLCKKKINTLTRFSSTPSSAMLSICAPLPEPKAYTNAPTEHSHFTDFETV